MRAAGGWAHKAGTPRTRTSPQLLSLRQVFTQVTLGSPDTVKVFLNPEEGRRGRVRGVHVRGALPDSTRSGWRMAGTRLLESEFPVS